MRTRPWWMLCAALLVTALVYSPGLSGSWLFDDYPNIVDNQGIQIKSISTASLTRAALSSPSSSFKRPLASLSFAANYFIGGLDPYGWKLFNLLVHLLNGILVFLLARLLLRSAANRSVAQASCTCSGRTDQCGLVAALIAGGWLLLPINVTAVLYVVQRMESMANLFVLLGLMGYVAGRRRMLHDTGGGWRGLVLCMSSLVAATAAGLLAKETAVMLPLYAVLVEWIVFGFTTARPAGSRTDWRIAALFLAVLVFPMLAGLAWLLPALFKPLAWATRDFTMHTRLLSEARIVVDYIDWTLLPIPHQLSFYHDDFRISSSLLAPWTTLACVLALFALAAAVAVLRKRRPLVALGLALFLGCHLLTGTVLPLELIFEHRNYFASFGLLLAVVPLLAPANAHPAEAASPLALARNALLGGLLLLWTGETAMTAMAWRNPVSMAESLAARAPDSPRAQYELGRTYIIQSNYDPASPYTRLAYTPLERAAALPNSSILPEQALIFMNARMHLPIKDAWWNSLVAKLRAHKPGVQDESSLVALTQCIRDQRCDLSKGHMLQAFQAALDHPEPSARLLATYGDYAWNVLDEKTLGLDATRQAIENKPDEPAYRITLIRMLIALGHYNQARTAMHQLQTLNVGGRLTSNIDELQALLPRTPGASRP
ncbi:hypothetical protein QMK61_03020 [Fulvimonas sp. R45]|uniref:hypothetical protein n=1 Tax=Fulvimonas sp. R45 TaxID=3045937 RepID=UPI00265EA4F7|nr:hypothetical protein [Fulvimonas sp. R45]MDO1527792.1 hypothetical protein [Fulvimonas sp. R45]